MLIPEIGTIFKSKLTGSTYELRKTTDRMVILHSLDGLSQILTGKENLNLFYEAVVDGELSKKK